MSALRFAIVCAAALAAGCAGSGGSGSASEEPLRREDTAVAQFNARVTAIDHKKRLVTLADESGGGEATFYADEAVRNFGQVKVGDELVGTVLESVVLELRQPTAEELEGPTIVEVMARAEPGQPPAGQFARQIQAILIVEAIDKKAQTATLRGPLGNSHTIKARDPANLERVKVGDSVIATYTEALSLEVRKPAP